MKITRLIHLYNIIRSPEWDYNYADIKYFVKLAGEYFDEAANGCSSQDFKSVKLMLAKVKSIIGVQEIFSLGQSSRMK